MNTKKNIPIPEEDEHLWQEPPEPPTIQDVLEGHPDGFTDGEKQDVLEAIAKKIELPIEKDLRKLIKWFDLVFDFENGEYWVSGNTKKHSLAIHDASGKLNHYYAFKILLKNKGQALTKLDLEKQGFVFLPPISNCKDLDDYLRKNLQTKFNISSDTILHSPRKWLKYDSKEETVTLVSD